MGNSSGSEAQQSLSIKTLTWSKDSYQLFDYDSSDYICNSFAASMGGCLVKTDLSVAYSKSPSVDSQVMLRLTHLSNNHIKISHPLPQDEQNQQTLWTVAQPGSSINLREGDTLRLGRVNFCIRQINISASASINATMNLGSESNIVDLEDNRSDISNNEMVVRRCRICYGYEDIETDPLISPCACSGSLQFTHLSCLRKWVMRKTLRKQSSHCYYYYWKKIDCEVCHTNFNEVYLHEGKEHSLREFQKPTESHIVLEYTKASGADKKHYVFICKMEEGKEIKIGRDQSSQIKVSEISVSRNHCSLVLRHGQLFVHDNKSKFGTLIKFQNPMQMGTNQLWMQYGSTLVKISRQINLSNVCCSCVSDIEYQIDGQDS